ncbi:hypothetical protein CAPTEDRAFT_196427 [Capitella teleta]|uniref:IkappaB kinase n=1 Tax=Capitella teleta TaxID=283909 RepID=R7TAG3_CAPTE|nr:hypothetical protein CAPTEDRAFT_196427 [Capitella teleta]|eukprot:ELT90482.1 hypothetical protein CAPTEDRAFT_196427 [Capitella teleta]
MAESERKKERKSHECYGSLTESDEGIQVYAVDKYIYYEDKVLDRRATGEVHRGRNCKTGQHVAVKVVSEAFAKKESEFLRKLKHDNIVKLLDVVKKDKLSRTWLILEWSKIGSVDNLLSLPQNKFGLSEEDLLAFLENMVDALLFLSQKNVVHGDIKPKNILVYFTDWRHEFKLTDFGISQYVTESKQTLEGTPEYMHPKVLLRQHAVDSATDLWSFAITLLHCCHGKLPFQVKGGRTNLALL